MPVPPAIVLVGARSRSLVYWLRPTRRPLLGAVVRALAGLRLCEREGGAFGTFDTPAAAAAAVEVVGGSMVGELETIEGEWACVGYSGGGESETIAVSENIPSNLENMNCTSCVCRIAHGPRRNEQVRTFATSTLDARFPSRGRILPFALLLLAQLFLAVVACSGAANSLGVVMFKGLSGQGFVGGRGHGGLGRFIEVRAGGRAGARPPAFCGDFLPDQVVQLSSEVETNTM